MIIIILTILLALSVCATVGFAMGHQQHGTKHEFPSIDQVWNNVKTGARIIKETIVGRF